MKTSVSAKCYQLASQLRHLAEEQRDQTFSENLFRLTSLTFRFFFFFVGGWVEGRGGKVMIPFAEVQWLIILYSYFWLLFFFLITCYLL